MNPRFPIYVISKSRWESRLTVRTLGKMGIPFKIAVEQQEFDDYATVIDPGKIIRLPFSELGLGSIPARNFVWEHSIRSGNKRHWILDDNINGFFRYHGKKEMALCRDGEPFVRAESFAERFQNIALLGLQYSSLGIYGGPSQICRNPFVANTRIYSCILILNRIPYRWRGRYNEDTDLSLRVLKDGWVTSLLNAFRCGKQGTLKMKGGNTDELYEGDGRLRMAQSLQRQHPDVCRITHKWGRWQHQVDYRPFKRNKLVPK